MWLGGCVGVHKGRFSRRYMAARPQTAGPRTASPQTGCLGAHWAHPGPRAGQSWPPALAHEQAPRPAVSTCTRRLLPSWRQRTARPACHVTQAFVRGARARGALGSASPALQLPKLPVPPPFEEGWKLQDGVAITKDLYDTLVLMVRGPPCRLPPASRPAALHARCGLCCPLWRLQWAPHRAQSIVPSPGNLGASSESGHQSVFGHTAFGA